MEKKPQVGETPSQRNSKCRNLLDWGNLGYLYLGISLGVSTTWSFFALEVSPSPSFSNLECLQLRFSCTWSFSDSEFLALGVSFPSQSFSNVEFQALVVICTCGFLHLEFLQLGLGVSPTGTCSFSNLDCLFSHMSNALQYCISYD